jgi:Kef-type K+ transport system membrane component KefB
VTALESALVADPVSRLGLAIALMLTVAKLGGDLATRLKQPSVLGELVAGILLGSVPLPFIEHVRTDPYVDMLARLGVLVLLFEVGLESTVGEVLRVGVASATVAVLGTLGTLAAGWAAAAVALPHASTLLHLFLGASLTATSIGISARVLKDSGASRSREAHTILGASVLDDILGLVVLAILTGAVTHASAGGTVTPWAIGWLLVKTLGFLVVALFIGVKLSTPLFRVTSRLRAGGALLATGLSFCFLVAWASSLIGLSPIVGAFTAGLVLEQSHSSHWVARGEPSLSERMEPISSWLVPIFFVLVGMRADFGALAHPDTLLLVSVLFAAAVVGKLACGLGAPRGTDRVAVALGMMPRGEVSLVFANLGLSMKLLGTSQYAVLVSAVVLTTLVTPPALRWRLGAKRTAGAPLP